MSGPDVVALPASSFFGSGRGGGSSWARHEGGAAVGPTSASTPSRLAQTASPNPFRGTRGIPSSAMSKRLPTPFFRESPQGRKRERLYPPGTAGARAVWRPAPRQKSLTGRRGKVVID